MNHIKSFSSLNRTKAHRKALYRNMTTSLLKYGKIETTVVKAKELKKFAEKILTRARVKNLHNIRLISKVIQEKDILKKLFDEIAPRYVGRNGGYTRIIKLKKRKGDGADMAYIELLTDEIQTTKRKKRKDTGVGKSVKLDKSADVKDTQKSESAVKLTSPQFQISSKNDEEFKYELKDADNNTLISCDVQKDKTAVTGLIESVKKYGADAKTVNLDSDEEVNVTGAKYEIYSDKDGGVKYRLKSESGEIIAVSSVYKTTEDCVQAIEKLKSIVKTAEVNEK
ncbi:MAG TPA: 50S ribosomal protein L17 [Spirochaetota bacterium]|nr:50S ribosomal protein L17 [Spirochaetota bacterium]HOS32987.1 50S ribosomal protein L17 [Spirochaetota bacterium]HOS55042.1 50S ribosomal protein L17 [Spirochaetota bacterium]HPK61478.1 50S ribosomal protein L17 [Spirochaetota bacterium]HQF77718.1 50S ribosomal protein L17 [Spirochaetota bacterium]